jgi:hypothetical protein
MLHRSKKQAVYLQSLFSLTPFAKRAPASHSLSTTLRVAYEAANRNVANDSHNWEGDMSLGKAWTKLGVLGVSQG